MNAVVGAVADAFLSVLFAPQCAACGQPLEHPTQGAVCQGCWESIPSITAPYCDACGDSLPSWRTLGSSSGCCARCRRSQRVIQRVRAVGRYDGALREIVHALKYQGLRSVAHPLGMLMRTRGADVLRDAHAVVPVPLHRARLRRRGFNQAADLARHLGVPSIPALRRARATAVQADLPAARRHANVRGAFAPTRACSRLRGRVVVLIDDVRTTGATLNACARVLLEEDVAEVRALTAARVETSRR